MIAPGQMLSKSNAVIPVVRVICRYPFDAPQADPRWVIEHINEPMHTTAVVPEKALDRYDLLVTTPLIAPLEGTR